MKKLMFALAAAASFAALADGINVTSDVVGYAGNNLRKNNSYVTPQFQNVTGGNMDLQDITCGDGCDDSVFIYVLNDRGVGVATYGWSEDAGGWYDAINGDYDTLAEGVSFTPGQGLSVQAVNDKQVLTTAGKVSTTDLAFQLRANNSFTGNCSPVEIDLQDITCGDGCDDSVFIYVLNDRGVGEATYGWSEDAGGWYDVVNGDYDTLAEGVTFAPGQGLCVQGNSDKQYITFPCADL